MTRFAAATALARGAILLAAGLFALLSPEVALTLLVVVGGIILIADGLLVLAAIDYGAPHGWPFWLAIARSILAIVAGLAVVLSSAFATRESLSLLATLVGSLAIAIGLIEIVLTLREGDGRDAFWPQLAGAGLYVGIGLVLILIPYASATVLMQIGGAILVVYALFHLVRTWRAIRRESPSRVTR